MTLKRFKHSIAAYTLALTWGTSALAQQAHAPKAGETHVLAYNIVVDFQGDGWARRKTAFHAFLARENFDILALQEVTEVQIADIAKGQPDYDYVLGQRSDGHRGDQNWYEFNPILYRRDRYQLLQHGSFWVSETPTRPGSILPRTKSHARIFTWVKLFDRQAAQEILVGSIHIHGLRAADEMQIILTELKKYKHNGPVLLLGDYNMTPDSDGYQFMATVAQMTDARRASPQVKGPDRTMISGESEYTFGHNGQVQRNLDPGRTIDYVFYCGQGSKVSTYSNQANDLGGGLHISDHFAQTARLTLQGACPFMR
jgi:endonuclease/exonuclease/phosphatase family metal-dependent hydrolase